MDKILRLSQAFSALDFKNKYCRLDNICTVKKIEVYKNDRRIIIDLIFNGIPDDDMIWGFKKDLKSAYGFETVDITLDFETDEDEGRDNSECVKETLDETQKEENRSETEKDNKAQKEEKKAILGSRIEGNIIKMDEIKPNSGEVIVCGEVFFVDTRLTKTGKLLYIFDVTDKTNSIRVKKLLGKKQAQAFKDNIKEGAYLLIKGKITQDSFTGETILEPSDIDFKDKPQKQDLCEQKRVELHLHTNMSAMDATNTIGDYVKYAKSLGHTALAVTDHGVLQAFPDAMNAGKKQGIKIIYGVEAYFVNDTQPAVTGERSVNFGSEFVVFDIETTGLNANSERITEIGAIKVKDGKISGEFSTFVNPGMPIPQNITELTGITDQMVAQAPREVQAVSEFLEFAQNCVLVAHNAAFDIGFIKAAASRCNLEFNPVYIDTLVISRFLYKELKRFTLDSVAKHLKLGEFNHHRATDDAKILSRIFFCMLETLKNEHGIYDINQINNIAAGGDAKKIRPFHQIILVKNYTGLKNLYKLVSISHIDDFKNTPRILKSKLLEHKEGLILGTACVYGELYSAVADGKSYDQLLEIAKFYDFLEIQPLGNNMFMVENGRVKDIEVLKEYNKTIVKIGQQLSIPVVATGDVHFLNPEDEIFRRILMAGKGFEDSDQAPLYYRTTEEMLCEFEYLGKEKAYEVVVTNSNLIADMCEDIRPVPKESFPPIMPNAKDELEEIVWRRAKEIYGENLPEIVQVRVEREMNSIIKHGFAPMYTIAQKLVLKSLSDGYLVGSRGSVGSSIAAFLSGITEVNSLEPHYICPNCKYSEFILDARVGSGADLEDKICPNCGAPLKKDGFDIPFETFLGFDGDKAPDIDLNFSGDYQSVAHRETEVMFGHGFVFRAGTIGTLAQKTAYGFVKKYIEEAGIKVNRAEENRLVLGCTGVKRTTGQHPGGVMIVPNNKEIFDFCPIQRPANDMSSDVITTHFDYHSIHDNLLKLDILGHDAPTIIKMLTSLTGVDIKDVSLDDKETMSIFTSTKALKLEEDDIINTVGTIAIPEFGTKFVRQMLLDTKPTTFAELVRISGLSHGTDVWINNAQQMVLDGVTTLKEVISTRDDIMIYLLQKGLPKKEAFTIMESVRKGKGLKEEWIELMKEHDVPDWYIQSCQKIQYMFPKAHAVAYVIMSFRIAYFKVHYPLEFYATYFSISADDFDAEYMIYGIDRVRKKMKELEALLNPTQKEKNLFVILEVCYEMYKRGFEFLPIDLYKSHSQNFLIQDGKILPPLRALQGLGVNAANNILEARKNGEFDSIDELQQAAGLSKPVIDILKQNGVISHLPQSNQISLFEMGF